MKNDNKLTWTPRNDSGKYDKQAAICETGGTLVANCAEEYARQFALSGEVLAILETLTSHAAEKYPHFESERGQEEIQIALELISKAKGGKLRERAEPAATGTLEALEALAEIAACVLSDICDQDTGSFYQLQEKAQLAQKAISKAKGE